MENELREALLGIVWQFAYRSRRRTGELQLTTGGLSALEDAFGVLGWSDPHIVEDTGGLACTVCGDWSTSGAPTPQGYRHFCGRHWPSQ